MSPPATPLEQVSPDNVDQSESGIVVRTRKMMVVIDGLPLNFAARNASHIDTVRHGVIFSCLRLRRFKVSFRPNQLGKTARLEISLRSSNTNRNDLTAVLRCAKELLDKTGTPYRVDTPAPAAKFSVKRGPEDRMSI